MPKIRIVKTPPGQAPEWVREAWIGLEMETSGQLDNDAFYNGFLQRGVLDDKPDISNAGGYRVNLKDAFDLLRTTQPKAFDWWLLNYAGQGMELTDQETRGGESIFKAYYIGELVFKKDVCEFVP